MGQLTIRVRAGAKQERIEALSDDVLKVWVTAPPEHERANQRVITLLADYLDVPKRTIHIMHGHHTSTKIIEISDEQH